MPSRHPVRPAPAGVGVKGVFLPPIPDPSLRVTTRVIAPRLPGNRAARQSGNRLNVMWLSGQYQRAIRTPRGVLRG